MKRFALLIAAVLLVGCSVRNNPVASGDTIYNVTGGEALFKVELKNYPLVVDSIVKDSLLGDDINATKVVAHFNIPLAFNMDTILCIYYNKWPNIIFTNDSIFSDYKLYGNGNTAFLIVDSSFKYSAGRNTSMILPFGISSIPNEFKGSLNLKDSFKLDIFIDVYCEYDSLTHATKFVDNTLIMRQLELIREKSWFTFEIFSPVDYKVTK